LAFLHNSRLQPFLDQAEHAAVGNAMLNELYEPIVRQIVEKAQNVTIQHPVHLLPRDPDVQRIQRLMLAAPWPETVRETPKVFLINLIQDRGIDASQPDAHAFAPRTALIGIAR